MIGRYINGAPYWELVDLMVIGTRSKKIVTQRAKQHVPGQ
jgi:hypothetical protein